MQSKEYTELTGKIKTFSIVDELDTLVKIGRDKPSSRIIRTKKGKKAIAGLIDLEENHNHSWSKELRQRALKDPNAIALFYRGNKITFEEMFAKADELTKSFAEIGIVKGDEIPCCLSNTPEVVYIMIAANTLGAKLNLFGSHFNKEYLKAVLDGCTDKLFLATDDVYADIEDVVKDRDYKNKTIISLTDSLLEHPEESDEYEEKLASYYHFDNKVKEYIQRDSHIMTFDQLMGKGIKYDNPIIDDNNLDTEFLVTYTSGSTKIGFPSQIIHSNRSLITSGRFHDAELSGNPELKGLRGLAHIHTESNTDIITCISDNLMQLWSVALEPEYDKKKALDYVMLNKPNYLNITTSFLIEMAKQYLIEKRFHEDGKGRKLPFLLAAFAVGEGLSKGEEKFINTFLRTARAGSGVKIAGLSLPFTTVCVGGGDCEHGGIYYSLWRIMYEKINYFRLKNREYGLMPEAFAQVSAFRKVGDDLYEECSFNEYGIIAANSSTTMVGYKNNKEKTKKLLMRDTNGRDWVSSNVYGYIDELGGVHVKNRIGHVISFSNGKIIPAFMIEDLISMDTKNILSCSVTQSSEYPIVNIEFQPNKRANNQDIIKSIQERCAKHFGYEIADKLCYRIFDNETSFPLTGSGKRSIAALEEMELKNVYQFDEDINALVPVYQDEKVKVYS